VAGRHQDFSLPRTIESGLIEVTASLELGVMVKPLCQGCAETIGAPKKIEEDWYFCSRINFPRTMKPCRPRAWKNHIAGISKDELTLIVVKNAWKHFMVEHLRTDCFRHCIRPRTNAARQFAEGLSQASTVQMEICRRQ
jgi:hypothetical protein